MRDQTTIDTERMIEFAAELIRLPSVLGSEESVALGVAEEMSALGYHQVRRDSVGNVVGELNFNAPRPTVLFDAHMDTVDVHLRDAWSVEPFSGVVKDGKLFGRGASDMKGALAAMVHGLGRMSRTGLNGRVVVCASVAEESTEGSAIESLLRAYAPDLVIIGESTGMDLAVGGRGRAEFVIETRGRPAHASTPHLGVSALQLMFRWAGELERIELPRHPRLGSGTLCLTDMISIPYPAQSVVPSGCRATLERRLLPGERQDEVIAELKECGRRAGCSDLEVKVARAELTTYTGYLLATDKWYPAWTIDEDSEPVRAALRALGRIGLDAGLCSYQFCTNAALSAGRLEIPTLGLGPSWEELAHVIDEYVEVDQLEKAAAAYAALARELLG